MTPHDYRAGLKQRLSDLSAEMQAIRETLESYQHAEAITLQAEGAQDGAFLLSKQADVVEAYAHGEGEEHQGFLPGYPLSITIDPVVAADVTPQPEGTEPYTLVSIGVEITQPKRDGPSRQMRADLHPEEADTLASCLRQIAILMETAANRAQEEVMAEFPLESQSPAQAADPMTAAGQEG